MPLPQIAIGIFLFLVALYLILKVMKNVLLVLVAIVILFMSYTFIYGSSPEVCTFPVIGTIIKPICSFSSNPSGIIVAVKDIFYNTDVIATSRDSQNNLLVVVSNTGKLNLSGFKITVDGNQVGIKNKIPDSLKSGETYVFTTNFSASCSNVTVQTNQIESKPHSC